MKIIELQVENVKRIRSVRIDPDGSPVVVLKGDNGAGKTSVLDAITYALAGKNAQPVEPIRRGAESATVVVDLGDLVVTRKWGKEEKQALEVKAKDGTKFASPQKMLDALVGQLTFDPLEFARLTDTPDGRRRQAELLKKLVGLDFSENEAAAKAAFERRTDVNRDLKALEARLTGTPVVNAPDEAVSMEDLLAEQQLLTESQRDQDAQRAELARQKVQLDASRARWREVKERIASLEKQLAGAKADLEAERVVGERLVAAVTGAEEAISALTPLESDITGVRRRIAEANETNELVRKRKARAELAAQALAKQKEGEALTARLAALADERRKTIEAAKFPVAGLGFSDVGVTLDGLPLEQASKAQQVRLSIAMGLALNPTLRVLLIRDANVLDAHSMQMVAEMAEQAGAQVWLERAGRSDAVGILIEDGEVVAVHAACDNTGNPGAPSNTGAPR